MFARLSPWLLLALPGCLLVFPQEQPPPEQTPEPPPPIEVVCTGTLADCDDSSSNGCESDLSSDPFNCGECGRVCEPGAACNASSCGLAPEVVAAGQLHPTRIVAHEGSLYWIHAVRNDPASGATTGAVQRLRADLPYPDLFVSGQPGLESIAVDGDHVYWASREAGTIARMKRFGLPRIPEVIVSGLKAPRAIVRHNQSLYWASAEDRAAFRCAVDACSPSLVASLPEAVVAVAANDQGVFVAGVSSILRLDPLLTSSVVVAEQRQSTEQIVASSSGLFWIEQGREGTSSGVVAASDPVLRVIAAQQNAPQDITVDAEFVYWTNRAGGTVLRAPLQGGGAVAIIAANQDQPWGIAVDERAVYWTNYAGGRVMRQLHERVNTSANE